MSEAANARQAAAITEVLYRYARDEREQFRAALKAIADGNGVYGAQALEYKNIARKALGQDPL